MRCQLLKQILDQLSSSIVEHTCGDKHGFHFATLDLAQMKRSSTKPTELVV